MYKELIQRLRETSMDFGEADHVSVMLLEAVDAIEELIAYVRQIEELRKDGYYLQKTKMMTYGQAIMTIPIPEPPKEE